MNLSDIQNLSDRISRLEQINDREEKYNEILDYIQYGKFKKISKFITTNNTLVKSINSFKLLSSCRNIETIIYLLKQNINLNLKNSHDILELNNMMIYHRYEYQNYTVDFALSYVFKKTIFQHCKHTNLFNINITKKMVSYHAILYIKNYRDNTIIMQVTTSSQFEKFILYLQVLI